MGPMTRIRALVSHGLLLVLVMFALAGCAGSSRQESSGVGGTNSPATSIGGGAGGQITSESMGGVPSTGGTGSGGMSSTAPATGGTHDAGTSTDAADADSPDSSLKIAARPVAAAVTHACAIVRGAVYCWGQNQFGQLGNGTTSSSALPVRVLGLSSDAHALAAGWRLSCAVVDDGVSCWGDDGSTGLTGSASALSIKGLDHKATEVETSVNVGLALMGGAVYSWGDTFNTAAAAPLAIPGLDSGVDAIASGPCAIVSDVLKCWGSNNVGQLGNGTADDSDVPVQVQGLTSGITSIATGRMHACAVMNGAVYCWGDNNFGQLGHQPGTSSTDHVCIRSVQPPGDYCNPMPTQVQGLSGTVQSVVAGTYHTCAVVDGAAYCWGGNGYGQLGDGTTTTTYAPVKVQKLTGVSAMSAGAYADPNGYDETCAVANGDVYCWGSNAYGQLGNGTTIDSPVPVKVQLPDESGDQ